MLAQSFLSADELGCSNEDLAAAITVLGMLERGELVQVKAFQTVVPNGFNMGCHFDQNECGTVGCIGGWIGHIIGHMPIMEGWDDLFVPNNWSNHADEYTIDRCARALRAKLTTGKADWS